MFSVDDYKNRIAEVLFNHDLISKEVYLKCSKPEYIQDLPYDLRSNDPDELYDRLMAIDDELNQREDILKKAEYRIGVKTRDSERLAKRIEKNIEKADKAIDNINSESDKIVKNIGKVEDKINKISDDNVKKELTDALDDLKKAHNNFYDMELTGDNLSDYKKAFDDYSKASSNFNAMVKDAFNDGHFNKTDVKNSDSSANLKRIDKGITNFEKSGKDVSSDVQGISDNQRDIDYIMDESNGVSKSMDILLDEFVKTNNAYVDSTKTPKKISAPNPQMMLNVSSKEGDNFSLLPSNYEVYLV